MATLGAAEVTALVNVTKLVLDLAAMMYKSAPPPRGEASLNDDINFIKDEFEMMGAHLLDASKGRGGQRNSVARTWVRQARDLNYDVEDCFQELVIQLEKPPRSPSTPQARKAVADKIKCLRERMQQSNQRYKLIKDSPSHDHTKFATMPNSFASKKALVGRETEKSHIIQIITKDDKSRQIIPIWGMGGLGKSALARSIYESQEIGDRFQKYAWINLSHPFNAEGFLRSLILQLQESDITVKEFIKKMQLKDLIEESNKLLRSMSYFIVLDNVSSIAEWRFLIQQIPEDENASRIIVTTREKSVAEHCSIDNIYKLEPLKDDDALELFKKKVLMETANFDSHPEMVEQAKRILCKCNGLPLAIATVGGLLATRPKTAPEWVKFNEKFSFELENNPSLEMIRTVLTSNCEDLPYHLQLCFLYLSIFPEDQNIRRRRLVRRWIAEGYSSGTRNMTAEENGESYFADLVSRSIIQPSESLGGAASINNCRVHNLLQEISISKSAEEMFSFVLHNRSNLHTKDAIRHLSITSSWKRVQDDLKSIGDLSHVRSFTVCGEWQSFFISEKMTMLRVLDLEGTSGLRDHHIKNIITKLLHLKYLSLRGCDEIFWLPNALGNLRDLQTLDVRGTNIIILPATIVKLRKLQYLRAGRIPEDEQLSDPTGETDMKDETC